MKTFKTLLFLSFVILLNSCDNDNDPANNVCDTTYVSSAITNAYSIANGYDDIETMDLETHEYSVKINAPGEICSIGYQNPSTYTGGYTMEIINTTTSASYSGVHVFSQAGLDYQSIATPVIVNSGDIITIKRTILPGYTMLNETIGRLLRDSNGADVPYPITQGNIEFLSSNFYGTGGPIPNFAQPYIAFGFQVY